MSKSDFGMSAKFSLNGDPLKNHGMSDGGAVQQFIDSEVLRLTEPYIPLDTGNLKDSGLYGTRIGSGKVVYNTPYAASQYYHTADTRSYDSRRGGHFFARMKADHCSAILNAAQKKAGCKV